MQNPELARYIKEALGNNIPESEIRARLAAAGWNPNDVDENIAAVKSLPPTLPPQSSFQATQVTPPSSLQITPPPLAQTTPSQTAQAPSQPAFPSQPATAVQPPRNSRFFITLLPIVILGVLGGGIGFAYVNNIWPFSNGGYSEDKFLTEIFQKFSEIKSTEYSVDFNIKSEARDADAKPFVPLPENEQEKLPYQRDKARFDFLANLKHEITYRNALKPFPKTLDEINLPARDPSGKPYNYQKIGENKYEITVTFETDEAVNLVKRNAKYTIAKVEPRISGKTITLTKDMLGSYYFSGRPPRPSIAEILEDEEALDFLPANLDITFGLSGTAQREGESEDAQFHAKADVSFEDFIISVDGEVLKKGDTFYGRINKFPGLFWDISKIKQKWIKVTPEDLAVYGSDLGPEIGLLLNTSAPGAKTKKGKDTLFLEHIELFYTLLEKEGVTSVDKPGAEKIDGKKNLRYALKFHVDKIASFYKKLADEAKAKFGKESLFSYDESTFKYLESKSFKSSFEYLVENTTFTVWVDAKSGYPAKLQYDFRYVPQTKRLADKQFKLSATMNLKNVNQKISITPPKESLNVEDAIILLTGISKEEFLFEKQTTSIESIRRALANYNRAAKTYPSSLEDLKKTWEEVSSDQADPFNEYYDEQPFLKIIPKDPYTQENFSYSKVGTDDYKLIYSVRLPKYEKGYRLPYSIVHRDYNFSSTSLSSKRNQGLKYLDGKNTATSKQISEEAAKAINQDVDKDLLSDALEDYIGTGKNKKDSDGDGIDDGKEVDQGTDPLGSGYLKYKSPGGGLPLL